MQHVIWFYTSYDRCRTWQGPFKLTMFGQPGVEFAIPREVTQGGEVTLSWFREPSRGGAGRGCEVCEVWLIKG